MKGKDEGGGGGSKLIEIQDPKKANKSIGNWEMGNGLIFFLSFFFCHYLPGQGVYIGVQWNTAHNNPLHLL